MFHGLVFGKKIKVGRFFTESGEVISKQYYLSSCVRLVGCHWIKRVSEKCSKNIVGKQSSQNVQGNDATVSRWGGKLYNRLLSDSPRMLCAKINRDRPTIDRDIPELKSETFFGRRVFCRYASPKLPRAIHLHALRRPASAAAAAASLAARLHLHQLSTSVSHFHHFSISRRKKSATCFAFMILSQRQ